GLTEIAAHTSTPIALGGRLYSRWDFKPFFEQGVVDIIQPDLSHAGGILEVRKIAAMAEAYDVAVAPHCPLGPLALGACLQIAACTPNHAIQEVSLGIHYNTGGHDLLNFVVNKPALTPVDGYLSVPEGPGLGVDVIEPGLIERLADQILDRDGGRTPVVGRADQDPRRILTDAADDAEVSDRQNGNFGIGNALEHGHDRALVDSRFFRDPTHGAI